MERALFEQAIDLADELGYLLIATADANGLPHIAAAGSLAPASPTDLIVSEWFCPGTIANIQQNPHIALVIWDPENDAGFQLIGTVTTIQDLAMLDGYVPGEEQGLPIPQTEQALHVHVDRILGFSQAPHADTELETCLSLGEGRR